MEPRSSRATTEWLPCLTRKARACGGSAGFDPYYHLAPASTVAEFEQCKQDATNGALQALNSPNVSRAYTESFTMISGR